MTNYLSHRWPEGPPKAPANTPALPVRRHPRLRALGIVLLCVLGAAFLFVLGSLAALGITLAVTGDAQQSSNIIFPQPPSDTDLDSWTPEDLPWGQPDAGVTLALDTSDGDTLTSQELYREALPSIVYVTAPQSANTASVGSGVIVTQEGHVVTNYHIIQGSTSLTVTLLSTEETYEARVVGFDEELDLAVLKIEAEDLTPARLGDSDLLQVGDPVYAIGNPLGYLHGTMTDGIISSTTRQVTVDGRDMDLMQTSAALNSGNSGGALLNTQGQVVGITTAKITGIQDDTVIEGLGLVIPISEPLPFLTRRIQTGESWRPSLGILCYEAQMDDYRGVFVKETTPDTPAAQSLLPGDLIVSANGTDTPTLYALTRVLNRTGVGEAVELEILREGTLEQVSITLYDRLTQ